MSTYVYMRLLESAPRRYDLGIRLLSFGRVDELYASAAEATLAAAASPTVLEIGCGTGNLTQLLLAGGASVTAIDHNPEMLALAGEKLGANGKLELREMAAAEIGDRFAAGGFDAVASVLAFSEMSADEQRYVLEAAARLVRPGGRIVIADETRPRLPWQRLLHRVLRWPAAALTYLLTQTTTWAVRDLDGTVAAAGLRVVSEKRLAMGSMSVLVAVRQEG